MGLKELQNGSDIRGVSQESVPGESVNLTPAVAGRIGRAFLNWLSDKIGKPREDLKLGIGSDPRISGTGIKQALAHAATNTGSAAYDMGLASTPAMFMSTIFENFKMDGAIMITASHLPWNRNGMKFFTRNGGLEKGDISKILSMAENIEAAEESGKAVLIRGDLMRRYAASLRELIKKGITGSRDPGKPLKGYRIVVDAGNGSGGFFATEVLEPLGCDITGSRFLEPDGMFPNHAPNPEDPDAMASIQKAVIKNRADLGIIFDTDVDRAAFVDPGGNPVSRNELVALAASVILEKYPGTWIVTDSITSTGLTRFIEKQLGGHHHRFKRGYRNVINEGIRLNKEGKECHLAIETSGHAAIRENQWLDDGAYLAVQMITRMANHPGSIGDLISGLKAPAESAEVRIKIIDRDFRETGRVVIKELEKFVRKTPGWKPVTPNYEGLRTECDAESGAGWFLLRLSLHDPVLPLNLESDKKGGIRIMAKRLLEFFAGYRDQLDLSALEKLT